MGFLTSLVCTAGNRVSPACTCISHCVRLICYIVPLIHAFRLRPDLQQPTGQHITSRVINVGDLTGEDVEGINFVYEYACNMRALIWFL